MYSVNTICFQAICKDYRNATVRHIRQTLQQKFPDDWEDKLRKPFQKEWDKIRQDANVRRNTGELETALTDDADLLSVNHFFNLFDAYFDELFPAPDGMSEYERKQHKQAVLGWARTIKNLRDPVIGHPSDQDVSEADAFVMLDAARRVLELFDHGVSLLVAGHRDRILSKDSLDDDPAPDPPRVLVGSVLPPREAVAPRFVGRKEELGSLQEWLNDPYSRSWFLAGDGGKGKSAIAYAFAEGTMNNPPPDLQIVIWISAKVRRFEEGQSIELSETDFWDVDSALTRVLAAYGAVGYDSMTLDEKKRECLEYLTELPALIVLDDVDSLEHPNTDTMNFFLFGVAPTRSKVLLTSRRIAHYGAEAMTTQVRGFDVNSGDGVQFIQSRLRMYNMDPAPFSASVMNDILNACDGSPLFIQDLLRLCKVGEPPRTAIDRWKTQDGEAARRYALQREFDMLSTSAQRVLLCCALFAGPASFPDIQLVCDMEDTECRDAIQELQGLFLIPRPQIVEGVPRFTLNVNTRQLVLDVRGNTDVAQRMSSTIKASTVGIESTPARRRIIGQSIRQAVSEVKLDRHGDAQRTLRQALERYPEDPDLHGTLGWVYKNWRPSPRITDARHQFGRASQFGSAAEEMYRHWSEMEGNQTEWTSAAKAAEAGLAAIGSSDVLSLNAGYARSRLARDLHQQALSSRAAEEARAAEAHLKNALADLDDVETGKYQQHNRVHRAIVINYEQLARIARAQDDRSGEAHYLRLTVSSLNRWANEHPGDQYVESEKKRLLDRHPSVAGQIE